MTSIDVFVRDRFGEETASALLTEYDVVIRPWEQLWLPGSWRRDALIVPVSQVQVVDAERFVNTVCVNANRAYCAIVLEPRFLRVGPAFGVDTNGCYECFRARQLQHRILTDTDDQVFEGAQSGNAYVREAYGHLPTHVRLARDLLGVAIGRISTENRFEAQKETQRWPQVFKAGLSHSRLEEFEVTPVHNCIVCSPFSENKSSEATAVEELHALSLRLQG